MSARPAHAVPPGTYAYVANTGDGTVSVIQAPTTPSWTPSPSAATR
ncbi:hypothetical protein V1460_11840 [Streptomyces sp. SCSIO 30461]